MTVLISYTLFLILLVIAALSVWLWATKRGNTQKPSKGHLETDLRLTYKRFKELYPYSKITYSEYKELQKEKAYKRAVSSQKIKRMVR
jgi:hypothetical protein